MALFSENFDISSLNLDPKGSFLVSKVTLVDKGANMLIQSLQTALKKERIAIAKNDLLAQSLVEYGSMETPGMSKCLEILSNCIFELGGQRKKNLEDIETYCISAAEDIKKSTRNVKERLKGRITAFNSREQRRKTVDKLSSRQSSSKLPRAKIDLDEACKIVDSEEQMLATHMEDFERKKINNIKEMCNSYILSLINSHAKALEQLTVAYNEIENIDGEMDLAVSSKLL